MQYHSFFGLPRAPLKVFETPQVQRWQAADLTPALRGSTIFYPHRSGTAVDESQIMMVRAANPNSNIP